MVCPMCGNLREDCSDPEKPWFPQRHICYASRAQSVADRMYHDKHDGKPFHGGGERHWVEKFSPKTPFHFRDGVRVWVSDHDLTPEDTFI